MTDVVRLPGTDRTVPEYLAAMAGEMALEQGAAEVGAVAVTRTAGDLRRRRPYFIEVEAWRSDDEPIRFSGYCSVVRGRLVLSLAEVPASDPFNV